MKQETTPTKPKSISFERLKEVLNVSKDRTIIEYVKKGLLPEPTRISDSLNFDYEKVCKAYGVTSLEEPFISNKTAADILSLKTPLTEGYCRKNSIPYYRIASLGGVKILFLKSEIELYQKISIEWQSDFIDKYGRYELLKDFLASILRAWEWLDRDESRSVTILQMFIVENLSMEDIGQKIGLSRERVRQLLGKTRRRMGSSSFFKAILEHGKGFKDQVCTLTQKLEALERENIELKLRMNIEVPANNPIKMELEAKENLKVLLVRSISEFDLSVRVLNCMKEAKIETLGELVRWDKNDFLMYRNFGRTSLTQLEDLVHDLGLCFGMKV